MKYFYDLLSHLEYELQNIRNNTNGNFVLNHNPWFDDKKKGIPNYYSYMLKTFKTKEYENADDYYGKKDKFVSKNNKVLKDVKNNFYNSYHAIDDQFQETKRSLINYIGYIRQYLGIPYEIKYLTATKMFKLVDSKQKLYPDHLYYKVFDNIIINIIQFSARYNISINYKSENFVIPKVPDFSKQLGLGFMKDCKVDYGYFDIKLENISDKVADALTFVKSYDYNKLLNDMGDISLKVIIFATSFHA